MAQDTAVTVAGTHGKSTTTSMIAVLLQGAGLDPSFAIGANVPALGVNAASGSSPGLRRGSRRIRRLLPELPPEDRRRDERRTRPPRLLRHRRGRVRLIRPLHRAAPGRRCAGRLRGRSRAQALARRTLKRGNRGHALRQGTMTPRFVLHDGGPGDVCDQHPRRGRFALDLHVPGRHNALNAAAAFTVALELGVEARGLPPAPWRTSRGHPGASNSRARAAESASTTTTPTTPPKCGRPCPQHGRWRAATSCTYSSSRTCLPGPGNSPKSSPQRSTPQTRPWSWTSIPPAKTRFPASAAS